MVGHTGNLAATIRAVEAVDKGVGRLIEPVLSRKGALIVTADHGNADDMAERDKKSGELKRDETGAIIPKTAHSLNPVRFEVLLGSADRARFRSTAVEAPGLGNVAATVCTLLGFEPPALYMPRLIEPV